MKTKTKVILITCTVVPLGLITYLTIRAIRVRSFYNKLMPPPPNEITGTIEDSTDSDQAWNPNYWATLIVKKVLPMDYFNITWGKKIANDIFKADDEKVPTIMAGIRNKALFSYVSYWYLKNPDTDQTLLRRVKNMDEEYSTIIHRYTKSIPSY